MTSLIEELEGTMSRPFTDHPPYPMLAHKRDLVDADSRGWVAELKMDGRRAMAIRTANGVDIYSRNMKSQKGKCPHLEDAMMDLPPGTVLDGEVVMPNDEEVEIIGKMTKSVNFTWTANVIGSKPDRAQRVQEELGRKIHFVTFDCMYLGYRNLMNDPFNWRRKYLVEVFEKYLYDCPYFVLSPLFEPGDELVEEVLEAGYEGIMLKHKESTYEEGGRGWGKYKFVDDADTVVMGFTDGQGKYSDTIGKSHYHRYLHHQQTCTYPILVHLLHKWTPCA